MGTRWVILSDLHLGADQSVLTADDGVTPSTTADAFAACLGELLGDDQPTLVLAGDAIELALSEMGPAFTVFERFLKLLRGDEPAIGKRIIYVPGNHDHHLWQVSRQQGFMQAIADTKPGDELPKMWFTSGLNPDEDLPLSPLVALLRRDSQWDGVFVDAVYPNLALNVADVKRTVVVHHGHFIESIYSAMSRLGSLVFPADPLTTVEQMERENNSWIDFLWSELGRSGAVGNDLHTAYHLLPDAKSVRHLSDGVADRIAARWKRGPIPDSVRRWLVRTIIGDVVSTARALETHEHGGVLSPGAERGLHEYLKGPLANQLADYHYDTDNLAFVFGHTHKPYQQLLDVGGSRTPIAVYNTGGWVNERAVVQRTQGAQAILVDDDLNVIAVEFYRQASDPKAFAVRVREPLIDDKGHNSFYDYLSQRVHPQESPWSDFSSAVAAELGSRQAALARLYDTYES